MIQSLRLALIGLASASWTATLGAAIAGVGFSLVFPGLGLEVVQRVSPSNRGIAMGCTTPFSI